MKNKKGFTLIELLAVIVILGLLMAVAIPSVTKYMEKSRRSTLMASIKSYIEATTMEVNSGELQMYETNVIYAVPVECVALERGGENPFGEWSQSSDEYWAYVLVQYDPINNKHIYGFTFKDSAGFGMYPTILNKISESGKEVDLNLNVSRPKTGLYTYLTPEKEDWNGFTVNDNTRLKVFTADDAEDSEYKCKIYKKGSNYEELKNKINTDFGILVKNKPEDTSNTMTCSNYELCYGGNNGELQYDQYGGIVFDEDNPVVLINEEETKKVGDEFSINLTVKAKANQTPPDPHYLATIVSLGNEYSQRHLGMIGFYKNYLHVYTYTTKSRSTVANSKEEGFLSIKLEEDGGNTEKLYNIQVTCKKGGKTRVYINGKEIGNGYPSGKETIDVKQTTIGDLRPYRNLKFTGTLYEIEIYNRIISDEEIIHNYERSQNVWKKLW